MEEKNRFSQLLKHLITVAELKHETVAQEVQYDPSYISKWVSGRMLPAEKTGKKVLMGISHSIVTSGSKEGVRTLFNDYQVDNLKDLQQAIYDNLEAEYNYVRELQNTIGTNVAPKTAYFSELTLPKYVIQMHHPVLRRVKSLNIMAMMDLLTMDHEYRMQIVSIENSHIKDQRGYPDVHFSMMIDLKNCALDYVYDVIFLINMMSNMTHLDFQLYSGTQAHGRAIFAVQKDFAISGMLVGKNRCMSVVVTEDKESCEILYNNIQNLCSRERLLFRPTTMQGMIQGNDYIQTLLYPNLRWLMGHMTEHFMPEDLFEEIVAELEGHHEECCTVEQLRKTHCLTRSVLQHSEIRLMIYESALSDLAISDEFDFYNYKIRLTSSQRLRYMEHIIELFQNQTNLKIKLVYGRFVSDFQYIANQCLFMSDAVSYLRMGTANRRNNIVVINRNDMQGVFDHFYEEIWENCPHVVISERNKVVEYVQHITQGIRLMSQMK
jgi:hypothetical protein